MKEKFLLLSKKISYFQTRLLLSIIYIFVISPIALIWKLIGKDPMDRKWKEDKKTFMIKYPESEIVIEQLDKPY